MRSNGQGKIRRNRYIFKLCNGLWNFLTTFWWKSKDKNFDAIIPVQLRNTWQQNWTYIPKLFECTQVYNACSFLKLQGKIFHKNTTILSKTGFRQTQPNRTLKDKFFKPTPTFLWSARLLFFFRHKAKSIKNQWTIKREREGVGGGRNFYWSFFEQESRHKLLILVLGKPVWLDLHDWKLLKCRTF